jgi:hypothetical protein
VNERAWVPVRPGRRETTTAAVAAMAVAAGTAAVTFWLVRTLLSRDPVDLKAPKAVPSLRPSVPPQDEAIGRLP